MPSPLDKTLPSGSSCFRLCLHALPPVPACTTTCACMHYRLRLHALPPVSAVLTSCLISPLQCLVVEGISHRWCLPYRIVLSPGVVLGVTSSEVSSSLSVSKETCAFILKNRDVIKPLFQSMMSSFCILIGCQGDSDAP